MDQMASCLLCGLALWKGTNGGSIKWAVYLAMTLCELQCVSGLWTVTRCKHTKLVLVLAAGDGGLCKTTVIVIFFSRTDVQFVQFDVVLSLLSSQSRLTFSFVPFPIFTTSAQFLKQPAFLVSFCIIFSLHVHWLLWPVCLKFERSSSIAKRLLMEQKEVKFCNT